MTLLKAIKKKYTSVEATIYMPITTRQWHILVSWCYNKKVSGNTGF